MRFTLAIDESHSIRYIPIQQVAVDTMNMRYSPWIGDESDSELIESIKENGVLTPLMVRPVKQPPEELPSVKYGVIAGNRRYHAALEAALKSVPCVVLDDCDDLTALSISLQENIHQKTVTGYDKLKQLGRMYEILNHGTPRRIILDELHKKSGLSEVSLRDYLNFLDLPEEIQELAKDPGDRDIESVKRLEELGVPQDISKLSIAKGAILARHSQDFTKDRFVELVTKASTLSISEKELPELIAAVKAFPKLPIDQVYKDEVKEIPKGEEIKVFLSSPITLALRKAIKKLQIDRETLIVRYIERGLREDGFY